MCRQSKILAYRFLFLIISLSGCSYNESIKAIDGQVIIIDSIHEPVIDYYIDSVIDIYRAPLQEEMNRVLAYSSQTMRKGTPEDLLNNFVADLILDKARILYQPAEDMGVDFCLLNYGGLRTSIPEGPVTMSRIYELMPFENEMVILTITPENTWELFEYIASRSVGMPVAGIRLGIRDRKVASIEIGGLPFNPERNYKIITSDYLAAAGDNMRFFLEPVEYEPLGMRIRDAIIQHLEKAQESGTMISSTLDGRLYYAE